MSTMLVLCLSATLDWAGRGAHGAPAVGEAAVLDGGGAQRDVRSVHTLAPEQLMHRGQAQPPSLSASCIPMPGGPSKACHRSGGSIPRGASFPGGFVAVGLAGESEPACEVPGGFVSAVETGHDRLV